MIRRNIFANYIGAAAMVAAPVIALPWYLSILGPKQFGLISFVTALQAFLGLLDSGISQVSMREFSVRMNETKEGRHSAATLLFGFERIYWIVAVCAGIITLFFSDFISNHWLVLDAESTALALAAVCGAAVIFTAQFPGTLYRSFLAGAQAQVTLNAIAVTGLLLRHVGGVILLTIWPQLSTYLIWQAGIAVLETAVRHYFAWKILDIRRVDVTWNSTVLGSIWPRVAKMSGAVILGALAVQMDKIILSRMLPIEQFGYYVIASTISQGVLNLIYPLVQAISPRIMQLSFEPIALRALNIKLARSISIMVIAGAAGFTVAGEWVLGFWLRDPKAVAMVHPLLSILLIGSALNAFYHVGYFNWLANGQVSRILLVNVASLLACLAVTPPLVSWHGIIGATFGFVAMNALGLVISLEWLRPVGNVNDPNDNK